MFSFIMQLKLSPVFMRLLSASIFMLIALSLATAYVQAQSSSSANASQEVSADVRPVNVVQVSDSNVAPVTDPVTILRNSKLIYIRKKSVYFKASELENELRKRPEFQSWGLLITRNDADADLIIEVGRKLFTTKFIFTVIDPRTDIVVMSGKADSIGSTVAKRVAEKFIKQMRAARP